MPSRRRVLLSDNHEILRFLPESKAPFNKLRATSSNKILSQSSNTTTQLGSLYLYRVWYRPIGVALPLTTSARSRLPAILSNIQALSISCSTPKLLPTPGGPLTIIARMSPLTVAFVISCKMSNRSRIRSIACSSVSAITAGLANATVLSFIMSPFTYSKSEIASTRTRTVPNSEPKWPSEFTVT